MHICICVLSSESTILPQREASPGEKGDFFGLLFYFGPFVASLSPPMPAAVRRFFQLSLKIASSRRPCQLDELTPGGTRAIEKYQVSVFKT